VVRHMIEFTYEGKKYSYQAVGQIITMIFTGYPPSLVTDKEVKEAAREHLAGVVI